MNTGRCLCGSVRFEFEGRPDWVAHCHCDSCRRNTGSAFTTWFGVADGRWRFTGDTPQRYESSAGATRLFCGRCGTPMAFRSEDHPGEMHFYLASLDPAADFPPTAHVHHAERVHWVELADKLKRFAGPGGGPLDLPD